MELHRGQHPHAKSGGSWSIRNQAFESSGPVAWDDKIEIERAMWEERFVPKLGNGQAFNPIAQYDGLSQGNVCTACVLAHTCSVCAPSMAPSELGRK